MLEEINVLLFHPLSLLASFFLTQSSSITLAKFLSLSSLKKFDYVKNMADHVKQLTGVEQSILNNSYDVIHALDRSKVVPGPYLQRAVAQKDTVQPTINCTHCIASFVVKMAGVDVERAKLDSSIRNLKLSGHVGFDSLPDQLVNKSVQNGFLFNILCIGETGLGKSTLMDSLFNTSFESTPSPHNLPSVKLKAHTYELQESNVRLKLTIVDTVGYGDQINKEDSFKAVVDYIDAQFEAYLQEELKIKRSLSTYHDSRIHVCLYFICPTGHGLKSIDLVCMKKLDTKVNIIPIIAKADTISKTELQKFKSKIISELQNNGVHIYQFPTDDESVADVNTSMNAHVPFAVVGSTDFVRVGNKMMRSRQYPWGTVQVENESHCDFVKLREMLIRTNMEDMREKTHCRHYELYRKKRLEQMGFSDVDSENKPVSFQQTCEAKRSIHLQELQQKEDEMRQMFVARVKEKEAELKEAEKELHNKFDKLKKDHTEEKKKLEENRKKLEDDILEFNRRKTQFVQQSQHHTLTLGKTKKK